jgi:hypothetical protein
MAGIVEVLPFVQLLPLSSKMGRPLLTAEIDPAREVALASHLDTKFAGLPQQGQNHGQKLTGHGRKNAKMKQPLSLRKDQQRQGRTAARHRLEGYHPADQQIRRKAAQEPGNIRASHVPRQSGFHPRMREAPGTSFSPVAVKRFMASGEAELSRVFYMNLPEEVKPIEQRLVLRSDLAMLHCYLKEIKPFRKLDSCITDRPMTNRTRNRKAFQVVEPLLGGQEREVAHEGPQAVVKKIVDANVRCTGTQPNFSSGYDGEHAQPASSAVKELAVFVE